MADELVIFQEILEKTAEFLGEFVNETSGNVIAELAPFLTVAFMIVMLWYAYKVMIGQSEHPVSYLIMKCLTWSIVMGAALTAGTYQADIASLIQSLPNDVASAVVSDSPDRGKLGSLLDGVANTGVSKAKEVFDLETGLGEFGKDIFYAGIGAAILIVTAEVTIVGFIMLMLATVAVSFLAAIGPFFIAALMFDSTRHFFWSWVNQVLYWVVYMVMFALCALFILGLYTHYLDGIVIKHENLVAATLSISVIAIFGSVIFFMIPRISSGLTGGSGGSMVGAASSLVRTVLTTVAMVKTAGAAAGIKMGGSTAASINRARSSASAATRPPPPRSRGLAFK